MSIQTWSEVAAGQKLGTTYTFNYTWLSPRQGCIPYTLGLCQQAQNTPIMQISHMS